MLIREGWIRASVMGLMGQCFYYGTARYVDSEKV